MMLLVLDSKCSPRVLSIPATHFSRTDKSCDSKVLLWGQFFAGTVQGSSCSPLFSLERANPAATPKTMPLNWVNRLPSALQGDVFSLSGAGFW